MKKTISFFIIFFCLWLLNEPGFSNEINFVSQPEDSLFSQTYCWQPGNTYRPLLPLDGEWEYSIDEKNHLTK